MTVFQRINPAFAKKVICRLEDLCKLALIEDAGLTADQAAIRLYQELDYYRGLKLEEHSIADVFRRFCMSLANRDRLWNLIYGARFDELDLRYGSILAEYEPTVIVSEFQNQEDRLLSDLLKARQLSADKTQHQRTNPRSQFRLYAKGILAGAEFFSCYPNGLSFKESIADWLIGPTKASELPYHFRSLGIPGFGPALASDFLKEVGVKEYGKPDRWVKRCMEATGWISDGASEADIQMVFWDLWEMLGTAYPPVVCDKLMFLVGSGSFVMVNPTYLCASRFEAFDAWCKEQLLVKMDAKTCVTAGSQL